MCKIWPVILRWPLTGPDNMFARSGDRHLAAAYSANALLPAHKTAPGEMSARSKAVFKIETAGLPGCGFLIIFSASEKFP